jgi:SAM-dependent methyltransferase
MSERREQLRTYYDGEMHERATKPLGADRERHLTLFIDECRRRGLERVLEVGCGAGRDGTRLRGAGLTYQGLDLSRSAVSISAGLGLRAVEGLATDLPFADASFDAAWTMSTLMHLEGDEMVEALTELARVVRPGGLVEIGVWGHVRDGERTAADGRYFRHRTDERFQELVSAIGPVEAFETWDWLEDDAHYQWARVTVAPDRRVGATDRQ